MAEFIERIRQVGALLLVPIILIVVFALVKLFHDVLAGILASMIPSTVFGFDLLVTGLSLVAWIGAMVGVFLWVRAGGPGILK